MKLVRILIYPTRGPSTPPPAAGRDGCSGSSQVIALAILLICARRLAMRSANCPRCGGDKTFYEEIQEPSIPNAAGQRLPLHQ